MKPISFCINTSRNEREYLLLLLNSLKENTQIENHEVLIFIDSDNQNTYEALIEYKNHIPSLKICKNTKCPLGHQRNSAILFNEAKNDIICYLQSDMVVGLEFDKHIIQNLTDKNTVLSCARIEPPIHPESPEKITKNFGLDPEEFNYEEFKTYVKELQNENRPNMDGHFAPFAVYKETWFDKLGSFDTQFRCSREDSDTIIRMHLLGLKLIQSWNACVYHFTCVSSRGTGWYKNDEEANYKNELQRKADEQELKRFYRKWGYFGHVPKPVYDITFNIELDHFADINVLNFIEPYCTRMYVSDINVVKQLRSQLEFESYYYSNLRWQYTDSYWENNKQYFFLNDFKKRILPNKQNIIGDSIVSFKYSDLIKNFQNNKNILINIQDLIHTTDIGDYEFDIFNFKIIEKNNLQELKSKFDYKEVLKGDFQFI